MSESIIAKLRRECALSGTDFLSPAKRYKMSRCKLWQMTSIKRPFEDACTNCTRPKNIRHSQKLLVENLSFIVLDLRNLYCLDYRKCCESIHFSLASSDCCKSCWMRCRRRVMEAPQHKSSVHRRCRQLVQ